jgi:hypothetical protein
MHTATEVQVRKLMREVQRKQPETIRQLLRLVNKYGDVDQPGDEDPCGDYDYHYQEKCMMNSRGIDMSPFVEWRNERGDLLIGDDLFRVAFEEGGCEEDVWFQTDWRGDVLSLVVIDNPFDD